MAEAPTASENFYPVNFLLKFLAHIKQSQRTSEFMVAMTMVIGIIRVPEEAGPLWNSEPWRYWKLFNKKMKTDVWALVGIVVTTIQVQQVTH